MKNVASLGFVALLAACATTATKPNAPEKMGTSCEDAIVIHASNEKQGIKAEYDWIARHYPGYHRAGQGLGGCKFMADTINITTSAGEKKTIYFDISSFFGKW